MTGLLRIRRRLLLSCLLAGAASFYGGAPSLCRADDVSSSVQLDFKIQPSPTDSRGKFWLVEILRPTGSPVRFLKAIGGQTLHFKDLDPGIYNICLAGTNARRNCESVDLTPPPGQKNFHFRKEFQTPQPILHQEYLHTVDVQTLSVPRDARREMQLAQQDELRGDHAKAIDHLKKAVEMAPEYADALNNLGTYYHRQGKEDLAIECFTKVTQLNSGFYGGWVNLAGSLITTGHFREALPASHRALSLRPNNKLVIAQVALNYYYLHDLEKSKVYFQKLLESDPASAVGPQLYLAHIALAQQKQKEAAQYLEGYLKLHPNSPQAGHLRKNLHTLTMADLFRAANDLQANR